MLPSININIGEVSNCSPGLISNASVQMEIAGLAFGAASLVGLYSACIEAIDRIESYRHFGSDRKQLLSRLDANKDILQQWAERVGISPEGLLVPHDTRLDDSSTAKAAIQILTCIRDLLGHSGQANDKPRQDHNQNTLSAPKRLWKLNAQSEPQAPSRRRDKLAWTLYGKEKFESQVIRFTALVETLDRLVPRYGSSDGKVLDHQSYLTDFKSTLPPNVPVLRDLEITKLSQMGPSSSLIKILSNARKVSLSFDSCNRPLTLFRSGPEGGFSMALPGPT